MPETLEPVIQVPAEVKAEVAKTVRIKVRIETNLETDRLTPDEVRATLEPRLAMLRTLNNARMKALKMRERLETDEPTRLARPEMLADD